MIATGLSILAFGIALWLGLAMLYRWAHTAAWLLRGRHDAPVPRPAPTTRFAVLIPAHNEELLLGDLLDSIALADYPADRLRCFVVADNCEDGTARVGRERGATVFERSDKQNPGKGQALHYAIGQMPLEEIDAVLFMDADGHVDPGFFALMDAEIAKGARVLQGTDKPSNPDETRLTRMIAVTAVMKNELYHGGKRALGLSGLLIGTGMVIATDVLRESGWGSFSIGEDLEQSLAFIRGGERILFVPWAVSSSQEAVDFSQGYVQRQRWASGRTSLRRPAIDAIRDGLQRGDASLLSVGLELLLPTYSMTLNLLAVGLVPAVLSWSVSAVPLALLVGVGVLAAAEIATGAIVMRAPPRYIASFVLAPAFLVWKAAIDALASFGFRGNTWSRTRRHESTQPPSSSS